ncbi:transcriptional regulator [Cereibacter sphaeroides]|nr:transcriptional regulator [Cereibacter sphaeroides]
METDRVERKRNLHAVRDRILQAICAFSNDLPNHRRPGVVFVGQEDNGTCSGTDIDDQLLQAIGGMRSDGQILPFPIMSVRRMEIDGCTVAAITVAPSAHPPVRYNGRTWIRVGPRRAAATLAEEKILEEKQIWKNLTFDYRACGTATVDDLNLARFEEEYVPAATSRDIQRADDRETIQKLKALRMVTPQGAATNASVLLLGQNCVAHINGAYIQFVRYNGLEMTDEIVDQKEIHGTVPDQVRALESLLRINIRTAASIGGGARTESSDYPLRALEQICRNAILHRNYDSSTMPVKIHWYANRIEIINPGGLYGEVTPENIFSNVTAYRNPLLAEGMKNLGIVERFGVGLKIARADLAKNGNPELEFQFEPNITMFVVRSAQ